MLALLFMTSATLAHAQPASCEIAKSSVVSVSSSGLMQVSNLALIEIKCSVHARPFPSKPGESISGLKAATTAYEADANHGRKEVPSEANVSGGGGEEQQEYVTFSVHIPLEPAEQDKEARKIAAAMESHRPGLITDATRNQMLEGISEMLPQNRVGHFQVDCRVLDDNRVVGVGVIEFEVLFKGNFSDNFVQAAGQQR
jgi:hypothetical protein